MSLKGFRFLVTTVSSKPSENCVQESGSSDLPALEKPLGYTLVWTMDAGCNGSGYVWLPNAPDGYKPVGFLVTLEPDEPDLEEIRCVRSDLTESTEACDMIFSTTKSILSKNQFQVWTTRPCKRGMLCRGVSVGTFFCATNFSSGDDLSIACLKNLDSSLHAMPNLNQVHALIKQYGPTVYFHPDEVYLPSSVPWFFENGSLLYKDGDKLKTYVKCGNIDSAELYVHVKPASGGTFTDIVMWVFCPFNGPATLKIGLMSYEMNRIGEHVSDWEHYTL
nr:vacuolar protein sorting-associated protein 62 isoform X2 [Ipomoea batatas]